ncbi:unnamed protein product, partial [marine sediment metagenome]
KSIEQAALDQALQSKVQTLTQSKQIIQQRKQRHQKNVSRGIKGKKAQIIAKGHYDKAASKLLVGSSKTIKSG